MILHEPFNRGKVTRLEIWRDNLYVLADPPRVWRALLRRLGLYHQPSSALPRAHGPEHEEDSQWSPYEAPFESPEALRDLMPKPMKTVVFRSQGFLGGRIFPAFWQGFWGKPLAVAAVRLDEWISKNFNKDWTGDALFAVFQKTENSTSRRGGSAPEPAGHSTVRRAH